MDTSLGMLLGIVSFIHGYESGYVVGNHILHTWIQVWVCCRESYPSYMDTSLGMLSGIVSFIHGYESGYVVGNQFMESVKTSLIHVLHFIICNYCQQ